MNQAFLRLRWAATPHPQRFAVDFTACDKKAIEKKSKLLRAQAETRGCLFGEVVA